MPFVLDASACLPWRFRDEATEGTERLLQRAVLRELIFTPAQWPVEVLNGLLRAARRGRIADDEIEPFLDELSAFNIFVDRLAPAEQWRECLPLIRLYDLSPYDAAYLALAQRLSVPLATRDDRLRDAARVEGVPLVL